ncbi:MAG: hypothetical protein J6M92_08930, partial [Oribacterium sp.]|nr:hypothetical protein [Oribacterium sp.]
GIAILPDSNLHIHFQLLQSAFPLSPLFLSRCYKNLFPVGICILCSFKQAPGYSHRPIYRALSTQVILSNKIRALSPLKKSLY